MLGIAIWMAAVAEVALAADGGSTIHIVRHAEIPRQPGIGGTEYHADILLRIEGERLSGDGQVSLKILSPDGPWEYSGSTSVHVDGTLKDGRVQAAIESPSKITLVETRGGTIDIPFNVSAAFERFEGVLRNGRFEATESVATASGAPLNVTTRMEGGITSGAQIEIRVEHDIVPGHIGYFNKVSFRLTKGPAAAGAPAGRKEDTEVLAQVDTIGPGRIRTTIDGQGSRSLSFEKVVPGRWYEFYYSWQGGPPAPAHLERVRITAPKIEAEGEAHFDVGVDFEVVEVTRIMKRPPEIGRPELLRVTVRDANHPDEDAAALAGELGLRPELSLEQTGFRPGTTLSDFITGFSVNSSGVAEIVAAAMTGKGKAIVVGDKLTWNVGADGVLTGASDDLGHPYARFQQRGTFHFRANISGLAYAPYGGGVMREPESPSMPVAIAVTELDPDTQFLVDVLVPCMQGLVSATAGEPVEGWTALWECLDGALDSQLAQQALADHVLINAIAIWISELIDGGLAVADAAGQVIRPRSAEAMQQQVIEQFQQVAGQLNDVVVAAVSKDAIIGYEASSDRDGDLLQGPKQINLGQLTSGPEAARLQAAQDFAAHKRIQDGKQFVVIPASKGETLTIDLSGDGKAGSLIVMSKSTLTRAAYPTGEWRSKLVIAPDGTARIVAGTPIDLKSEPAGKHRQETGP